MQIVTIYKRASGHYRKKRKNRELKVPRTEILYKIIDWLVVK